MSCFPDDINYALRFPAETRTDDAFFEKFGAMFYNWMTSWRVNDGFSNGIKHADEDDGGHPGYIDVGL